MAIPIVAKERFRMYCNEYSWARDGANRMQSKSLRDSGAQMGGRIYIMGSNAYRLVGLAG